MRKIALLSVTNKTGLIEFGRGLAERGFIFLSTGGTAEVLRKEGLDVVEVADFTGMEEMFDGRLKTLHPKIFGGILARPTEEDCMKLEELGWDEIRLVVVNLYDFAGTVAKPGVTLEEAVEKIDIGGPSLLRAAAKNWKRVMVVCDPKDYSSILRRMDANGFVDASFRISLAAAVFRHTGEYEKGIAQYLTAQAVAKWPW